MLRESYDSSALPDIGVAGCPAINAYQEADLDVVGSVTDPIALEFSMWNDQADLPVLVTAVRLVVDELEKVPADAATVMCYSGGFQPGGSFADMYLLHWKISEDGALEDRSVKIVSEPYDRTGGETYALSSFELNSGELAVWFVDPELPCNMMATWHLEADYVSGQAPVRTVTLQDDEGRSSFTTAHTATTYISWVGMPFLQDGPSEC